MKGVHKALLLTALTAAFLVRLGLAHGFRFCAHVHHAWQTLAIQMSQFFRLAHR